MLKVESKIGTVKRRAEDIFNLLSDFRFIAPYIPKDQVENFVAENDKCSFVVQGQKITICIIDKEENNYIKYGNEAEGPINFFFWIQLKAVESYITKFKLTLHIELPSWMHLFVKGKIEKALNEAVDKISDL